MSWVLLCPFVPTAQEARLEKATTWLRRCRQVLCKGWVQGQGAGKEMGASASLPAAAPPRPPHPQRSYCTSRRNRTSICRECVWKIPGFIRQADVQADSFIPMHTIMGSYVGLCPSSLPPVMLSGKMLTPLCHGHGAWGFLAK